MRKSLTLAEARELTPPPEGVGAWADKLRSAAFNAVSENDVQEIMEGIKKRAKEGDLNAAKMLLGYLTASAPKVSQQIVVVQAERVPAPARAALGFTPEDDDVPPPPHDAAEKMTGQQLADAREQVARLLLAAGQMKPATIADQLGISLAQIDRVLCCPWFERTPKGGRLTEAGRDALKTLNAPE